MMTPEQNFQFRNLLSNLLNARATGESDTRQLAHEDHLRNYMDGLLDEKDAKIAELEARPIFSDDLLKEFEEYEKYKAQCESDSLLQNTDPRLRFYGSIFSMAQTVFRQWRKTQL